MVRTMDLRRFGAATSPSHRLLGLAGWLPITTFGTPSSWGCIFGLRAGLRAKRAFGCAGVQQNPDIAERRREAERDEEK